ncbi:hypothetical protein CAAN1_06S00760 [[Candida] anglica]|uniref:Uncharacterized protein n=1 Tax=[Candida] anglica TaxID=148631 RepID=A0ABP0EQE4_9ASCO
MVECAPFETSYHHDRQKRPVLKTEVLLVSALFIGAFLSLGFDVVCGIILYKVFDTDPTSGSYNWQSSPQGLLLFFFLFMMGSVNLVGGICIHEMYEEEFFKMLGGLKFLLAMWLLFLIYGISSKAHFSI